VADSRAMAFLPDFVRDRPAAAVAEDRRAYSSLFADKVVVKKAERRLYLIKADEAVMSYPISLGFSPEGHKQRLGDGRTPEGRYLLDWRNSSSKFHRSLHISYPNFSDRLRASRKGVDPGGMIMIHGQPRPNRYADLQPLVAREDWTEGCIAVPNYAIEEIWEQTMDGTPIEILP
jgi:murein L,D-transpeptidase YafK